MARWGRRMIWKLPLKPVKRMRLARPQSPSSRRDSGSSSGWRLLTAFPAQRQSDVDVILGVHQQPCLLPLVGAASEDGGFCS